MTTKNVLITGASSGFGLLAVKLLLARGFYVIAGVRGGESRFRQLGTGVETNDQLTIVDLHLDRPETFPALLDWLREKHEGRLDILINNAGFGLLGPVEDMTEAEIRYQFEVNVFGPIFLTRSLLPALRQSQGRILNISSIAGIMSFPFYGMYNATKHALEGHTEALRYELSAFGVQVGLIEPGGFQTDFAARALQSPKRSATAESPYQSAMGRFVTWLEKKAKHGAKADRVAELIVHLCEIKKVPIRTVIGTDACAMAFLKWLLPENFRVNLTNFIFWRMLKK